MVVSEPYVGFSHQNVFDAFALDVVADAHIAAQQNNDAGEEIFKDVLERESDYNRTDQVGKVAFRNKTAQVAVFM